MVSSGCAGGIRRTPTPTQLPTLTWYSRWGGGKHRNYCYWECQQKCQQKSATCITSTTELMFARYLSYYQRWLRSIHDMYVINFMDIKSPTMMIAGNNTNQKWLQLIINADQSRHWSIGSLEHTVRFHVASKWQ